MYRVKQVIYIFLATILPCVFMNSTAIAYGGYINTVNFGIHLGYPGYGYYDPFFYPPFHHYPPIVIPVAPPVVVPSAPPVYVQQQEEIVTHQPQASDWYYCRNPDGYYPYVKQCPDGWLRVDPQPASQ